MGACYSIVGAGILLSSLVPVKWNLYSVVGQFDITNISFTGTAGVSPAERASARSNLVHPYIVRRGYCSRYALAAGGTPAVPVNPLGFIVTEAFKLHHYPFFGTDYLQKSSAKSSVIISRHI